MNSSAVDFCKLQRVLLLSGRRLSHGRRVIRRGRSRWWCRSPPAGRWTLARIMAERMRASLGQPIIIENVAGAAGNIGVGRVARAAPDGYTLSIGHWARMSSTAQSTRSRTIC